MDNVDQAVRDGFKLLGREQYGRWALVLVAPLVVSVFEIVGAGLVYLLLALVADPGGEIELPVVGDVRGYFDGVDEQPLLLGLAVAMGMFLLLRPLHESMRPMCKTVSARTPAPSWPGGSFAVISRCRTRSTCNATSRT